jgi:hypothetical protein
MLVSEEQEEMEIVFTGVSNPVVSALPITS